VPTAQQIKARKLRNLFATISIFDDPEFFAIFLDVLLSCHGRLNVLHRGPNLRKRRKGAFRSSACLKDGIGFGLEWLCRRITNLFNTYELGARRTMRARE
jgi:hypothetical protein